MDIVIKDSIFNNDRKSVFDFMIDELGSTERGGQIEEMASELEHCKIAIAKITNKLAEKGIIDGLDIIDLVQGYSKDVELIK